MGRAVESRKILIIFYSFSSQTRNVVNGLVKGLEEGGVEVLTEQLRPVRPLPFPTGSYLKAFRLMTAAFLKMPVAVSPPDRRCYGSWDLVICAGPTWSYHPSGPMLYFLRTSAAELLAGRHVLPLICCRTYWRLHARELSALLRAAGARVMQPLVFQHPLPGFWCAVGVFVKLAGKTPRFLRPLLQSHCPRFGVTAQQIDEAREMGKKLAQVVQAGEVDQDFRCARQPR